MDICFDLDGTLADITHRLHYIKDGRKDWPAFYRACVDDKPGFVALDVFRALRDSGQHIIDIWSGRSDEVRVETEKWLSYFAPGYRELKMRKAGDYSPDHELKASWMEEHLAKYGSYHAMAVDDRSRVVAEWRKRGTVCFQIAEGNF